MSDERQFAICRQVGDDSDMEEEWMYEATISPEQAALGALPPDLVKAFQGATPEEMQEAADWIVVARAGLTGLEVNLYRRSDETLRQEWTAKTDDQWVLGDTRREALHALAEALKAEVTT